MGHWTQLCQCFHRNFLINPALRSTTNKRRTSTSGVPYFWISCKHKWSKIVFNATTPTLCDPKWSKIFWCNDTNPLWSQHFLWCRLVQSLCGDLQEELLPDMPEPLGNLVNTSCFVDVNHAGNVVTCHLHTEILLFVQNAPIVWYSKRQNTIESSTFGSEFVVLHITKDFTVKDLT